MTATVERWEACGNVYLLVERSDLPRPLDAVAARAMASPIDGLGGDGVLELDRDANTADVTMRIWNPDGSLTEACGNGTRMVARWISQRIGRDDVRVATDAGVLACHVDGEQVTAAMAPATLAGPQYQPGDSDFPYPHRFVSIGNPHVVIPVGDVAAFPLEREGPLLEHHAWFPERVNVEITMPIDRHRIRMRVWERGVGETLACGSGACAAAVAAVMADTAASPITVEVPGGELVVEVGENRSVTLTGPARQIEICSLPVGIAEMLAN